MMMKNILCILFLCAATTGFGQADSSLIKFVNPASLAAPKGYSHAAVIDLGGSKMVIISGQVALDSLGNLVGKGDFIKQSEQVFLNIKNVVTSLGGTMDNVVKLGYFVVDVSQIQALREIRNKFINVKNPPASTLVQVSKLFRNDILVEIEATAVIPKK
jgi:2-iminobutanoate/2-iminopropanoate deaminase